MEYRSFDGYGNNRSNPDWGRSGTALHRPAGLAGYTADGQTPSGRDRPNPREISNAVCAQIGDGTPSRAGLSDFVWAWGQFLDHELDLTIPAEPVERFDIVVRQGSHCELSDRSGIVPLMRSRYDPSTGTGGQNPRQHINEQTSYIDGSNVYGATVERAAVLRAGQDGKLKCSDLRDHRKALLPKNTFGLTNEHGPPRPGVNPADFFVAGDVRANEHVVLTSMHTLFLREHNRAAAQLKRKHRDEVRRLGTTAADEFLFQEARRQTIAKMQVITFKEFLPALLGEGALPQYGGYNANVDPTISNFFAHAAYRLGHSMVSPLIQRIPTHGAGATRPLKLEEAFWSPGSVHSNLIDELLNGLWQQTMQEIDARIVDGLRNHLFRSQISGQPNVVLDLAALNIQRGRDHGFPSYNECRIALGLSRKSSFYEITSDRQTHRNLQAAYDNKIEQIDPWIGGLAEDRLPGAEVGELIFHVLREQFQRLRDGDRFWFQAPDAGFSEREISQLWTETSLAQVIRDNTHVRPDTDDVFRAAVASG